MPERKCEVCGISDETPNTEMWSRTGRNGRFRCFCGVHVPRSWRRLPRPRG